MQYKKYHVWAFFFILFVGTALHFTYDLSGQNTFVSYFSAVNESTWEHLKLLFWPALVFGIIEYFVYGKVRPDFFAVKMTAILSGLGFIVVFFYTYSGILGFNLLVLDILDFALADFLCCYISCRMLNFTAVGDRSDSFKAIVVFGILIWCFVIWTRTPPDIGLFWG